MAPASLSAQQSPPPRVTVFGIDGALAPYLILIFFGFLPSEIWRFMSVFAARWIDESSEVFVYVRTVAAVLLVAIVGKLIFAPSGALAMLPLAARIGALAVGAGAFVIARRSVLAAVFAGEAAVIAPGYYFAFSARARRGSSRRARPALPVSPFGSRAAAGAPRPNAARCGNADGTRSARRLAR